MGYTGRIQRVIDCSNLESPGVFSLRSEMQSDFLQLAIAFAGYVCIGFCVYMISRRMLVDIDRKERTEEILVWIFFGAVWPLGIMFAATFLLMWIFTLPGDFYRKKARH